MSSSNLFATTVTATTTFQNLGTLLSAAGLDLSSGAVTSVVGYIKNNSTTINLYIGTGTSAPTTQYATATPLNAVQIVPGTNLNQVWIASASSTVGVDFVEGAVAQPATINGVIGTITLTDNTVPKGSSNNLVNSSIVDNGTTVAISEPITSTGAITTSGATAGSGYATGAGGAVTQGTSRTTTVTLSKPCGAITLFSAAGSATPFTFQVTNTLVAATDTIIVSQKSGTDAYAVNVTTVAAGSFKLTVTDLNGTTTEAPVINFSILKAVAS